MSTETPGPTSLSSRTVPKPTFVRSADRNMSTSISVAKTCIRQPM